MNEEKVILNRKTYDDLVKAHDEKLKEYARKVKTEKKELEELKHNGYHVIIKKEPVLKVRDIDEFFEPKYKTESQMFRELVSELNEAEYKLSMLRRVSKYEFLRMQRNGEI
jgi:effector-binding domain-containing protein